MAEQVIVMQEGAVCLISMQRPEKRNAITAGMYRLMADAIQDAAANNSVKVIVLAGSGGNFTAGNDLSDFLANPSIEKGSPVHDFLQALIHCPIPLIAAVDGFAIGIGSTLLLHCEQVFAAEGAQFSFPFVDLGLVPEAGSTLLLPAVAGYQKAADLLLSGRAFSAREAAEVGLVGHIVSGAAQEAALAYARQLSGKPRSSLVEIKRLMKRDMETLQQRADVELQSFVQCLNSPAAREAMAAFLEKRKPDFSNL